MALKFTPPLSDATFGFKFLILISYSTKLSHFPPFSCYLHMLDLPQMSELFMLHKVA